MKTRIIKLLTLTALLAGSGLIWAQAGPGFGPGGGPCPGEGYGKPGYGMGGGGRHMGGGFYGNPTRMAERLEGLKAELQLDPAQEPAWESLSQQLRDRFAQHAERRAEMQNLANAPLPERLDTRIEHMTRRLEEMRTFQGQLTDFYAQLNDAQKAVFDQHFGRFGQKGF